MSDVGTASVSPDNPLREPSPLPFGLPPFGDITPEHCREALLAGMAEQRAEVAAIVGSAEPPTFDNTVVALERSGRLLSPGVERCSATSRRRCPRRGCARSSGRSPRWRRRTPTRSGWTRRCSPASTRCTRPGTTPGSTTRRCGWSSATTWTSCSPGAQLDDAGRARLTELNQELSTLSTTFGQNLQLATEAAAVQVADAARAGRARRRGDRRRRHCGRRPRASRATC